MRIDFSGYTDKGGRAKNEDVAYSLKLTDGCLYIVADGLGGHDNGDKAAEQAISAIKNYYQANKTSRDIEEAIKQANEAVLLMQKDRESKAKTTIAVAHISNKKIQLAHVGDTRIYAFYNNRIVYQSVDHSASQMAVIVGEISVDEIRNHADRNILTRALGSTSPSKATVHELLTNEVDALLICSDGFWEYVREEEMTSLLHTSANAEEWLNKMRLCIDDKAPEGNDNNSAIAIRLYGGD